MYDHNELVMTPDYHREIDLIKYGLMAIALFDDVSVMKKG